MEEKEAKNLVMKLTNAAYEAGLWKDHANKAMTPHWQGIAENIGDRIVRHLTNESSKPQEPRGFAEPDRCKHGILMGKQCLRCGR